MGAAAALLAASAILSRLMGLVRDKVISWQFGAGSEADMYFAAFVVPDCINYLLAGGFMSITIIPLLARCFQEDEADAWRFFSCVLHWMFVAAGLLTLLGMIFAEPLARLTAPGFTPAQCQRLAFFMRLVLPAQIFFLSGACFTALLYLRRQFSVPALTPLVYNGCIIAAGVLVPVMAASLGIPVQGMEGYCAGVTAGAALGAFLLPLRAAAAGGISFQPVWRHRLMGRFLLTALPLMIGQTIVMLDEQFLRIFGSLAGEGVVSLLNYARRIAQVPVAFVGQAAAAASYPFLVSLFAQGDKARFNETLRSALLTGLGLIIPCALCMAACAWPLLGAIFQGGHFGAAETLAAAPLTRIMLAAAPFWFVYMVLVRGYYASGDTLTPAVTGTVIALLCLPVYYFGAVPAGAAGLAALSALSVSLYTMWLAGIWLRRHGRSAFTGLARLGLRALACSLPGAALAYYVSGGCLEVLPFPPIAAACAALAVGGLAFALLFVPLSRIFAPTILEPLFHRICGVGQGSEADVNRRPKH
ncbi:MAG: murein biosynthesis integral membrane protein MurJ [Desulfovibrio sp.]|jgi:putative peptidoglycan lipid II flippase|nr:murein biosynthesis integral membrane protein MurJ [Desulfovibrio sp.]